MYVTLKNPSQLDDFYQQQIQNTGLEIDIVYAVIEIQTEHFRIDATGDNPVLYDKRLFDIVDPHIPSDWVYQCSYTDSKHTDEGEFGELYREFSEEYNITPECFSHERAFFDYYHDSSYSEKHKACVQIYQEYQKQLHTPINQINEQPAELSVTDAKIKNVQNPYSMIFNICLIGVIRLLYLEKISLEQAEHLIFRPYVIDKLACNPNLKHFCNLIWTATELEDILSMLGHQAYQQQLDEIEKQLLDPMTFLNAKSFWGFEDINKITDILTTLGLNNFDNQ